VVFLRASLQGFRRHPRSGVRLSVLAVLVVYLLFRTRPGADPGTVGLIAVVLAGLCLFVPAAIHEAHGRWQLRPACWEDGGQWWLAISPRWAEPASCECVVTDRFGRSWIHDFGQQAGRIASRFPQGFTQVDGAEVGEVRPEGRHLARWTARQAGNSFEASAEFTWVSRQA